MRNTKIDPQTSNGDIWLYLDETDQLKPPSPSEPPLPVEAACLPLSEKPSLPLLTIPRTTT